MPPSWGGAELERDPVCTEVVSVPIQVRFAPGRACEFCRNSLASGACEVNVCNTTSGYRAAQSLSGQRGKPIAG